MFDENLRVRNDRSVDARPTGGPGAASRFGRRRPGPPPFRGSGCLAGSLPPMTAVTLIGPATSNRLAGTRWQIVAINGISALDGPSLRVEFGHDGRVSGSTGVNGFSASYNVTANYLTVGPVATTRRDGPSALVHQARRVVHSFAGMCSYRCAGETLSIDGPLGRVELRTTMPVPPPIGVPHRPTVGAA